MIYEVCYDAIDGTYYGTYNTLEEANKAFAFTLTMYNLVPLFEMYLTEINTWSDYKVIKSFKNMKVNEKEIVMAKACYSSYNRRF